MQARTAEFGQGLIEVLAALAIGTILITAIVSLSIRATLTADTSRTKNIADKLAQEGLEVIKLIQSEKPGCHSPNLRILQVNDDTETNGFHGSNSTTPPYINGLNANPSCSGDGNSATWDSFFGNDPSSNTYDVPDAQFSSQYGYRGVLHYKDSLDQDYWPNGSTGECFPLNWCFHLTGEPPFGDNDKYAFIKVGNTHFKRLLYVADTPTTIIDSHTNNPGLSQCNLTATDYHQIKQVTVVVTWNDENGSHQTVSSSCIKYQ